MAVKNRGAFSNPEGRFETQKREPFYDGWDYEEEESLVPLETMLIEEPAKSIISRNDSPDLFFEQSINPYQGCEHGCVYCYARPSHAYKNLSPGLDFETKIFYKPDAEKILEKELARKNYICKPILIGANTDPYQPAESKLLITRKLLQVLNKYRHPVTLITKGALILRDIDLLSDMASQNLVKVAVSVTTLSTKLKMILEPRTSTPKARLRAISNLSKEGIPVTVMAAPMIPMINDMELEKILELASQAGAKQAGYVLIRLPYEVKDLFKEWLTNHYKDRAEHVMSLISQMRGGKEYDATFGRRMKGEGNFAELLAARFQIACKRFKLNSPRNVELNNKLFRKPNLTPQMSLWE